MTVKLGLAHILLWRAVVQQILLVSICLLLLSQHTERNDKGPGSGLILLPPSLSVSLLQTNHYQLIYHHPWLGEEANKCSSGCNVMYILLSFTSTDPHFLPTCKQREIRFSALIFFSSASLYLLPWQPFAKGSLSKACSGCVWHYVAIQRWQPEKDNLDPLPSGWDVTQTLFWWYAAYRDVASI